MLGDLNKSPQRWKTDKIQSIMDALVGDESSSISKRITRVAKSYQEHLRDHVDLWLATGRSRSGSEDPSTRRPNAKIQSIVERIFDTHHAIPVLLKDGYTVTAVPPLALDTETDGLLAAELMFVDMLISDWRLKIAKCARCERYFKLRHWDRTYADGTVCARCTPKLKSDRAKRAMSDARKNLKKTLHSAVAERFSFEILHVEWIWHKEPSIRDEVVDFLNERIRNDPKLSKRHPGGLTQKWLAWEKNRSAIERIARKTELHGSL